MSAGYVRSVVMWLVCGGGGGGGGGSLSTEGEWASELQVLL